jgi:hypothetical protein
MAALNGKADIPLPLHAETGLRQGHLSLERLVYILGPGVLCLAVYAAQATAHADLFADIDALHCCPQPDPILRHMVTIFPNDNNIAL